MCESDALAGNQSGVNGHVLNGRRGLGPVKEGQGREGGGYIKEVEGCSDLPSPSSLYPRPKSSFTTTAPTSSLQQTSVRFLPVLPCLLQGLSPLILPTVPSPAPILQNHASSFALWERQQLSILFCHHARHYSLPPAYVSLTPPHRARQITVLHSAGPDADLQPRLHVTSRG